MVQEQIDREREGVGHQKVHARRLEVEPPPGEHATGLGLQELHVKGPHVANLGRQPDGDRGLPLHLAPPRQHGLAHAPDRGQRSRRTLDGFQNGAGVAEMMRRGEQDGESRVHALQSGERIGGRPSSGLLGVRVCGKGRGGLHD